LLVERRRVVLDVAVRGGRANHARVRRLVDWNSGWHRLVRAFAGGRSNLMD
jgi:hypothetical protein